MHLQNQCYSFPKRQLVPIPSNANLAMVFICKLFQSRLQVGQLKLYGVSPVLFTWRRLRCILRMC